MLNFNQNFDKIDKRYLDSQIIREIESTGAPFIRFYTNEGKFWWDAEVSTNMDGTKKVTIYQITMTRDLRCPIVANNVKDILEMEKNFGIDTGFRLGVWNPMRISK